MISITEKTLQDLQFTTILETLSTICNTDIGKQKALEIIPFKDKESLMNILLQTTCICAVHWKLYFGNLPWDSYFLYYLICILPIKITMAAFVYIKLK
jgi:hypothetical protein